MTNNQEFFQRINEAFAKSNTDFIIANVTDDIVWHIVGDKIIRGKESFIQEIKSMESENPYELNINHMITHGKTAAVDGIMKMTDKSGKIKIYAFCDIYRLSGFKSGKIKEMTSYVIETDK
ncbi:nuclear transport factor 2 family protein [Catalinimonas niigatensis]|uniref:nuclear transport factor 2 family protein n=1 Tax=Catalinimonas niigatensis TaxID=1397264 RepID=UPI0026654C79|nr:nuclear transport factor 2 family protein [Catalinimonas niigatensis]WPP53030.1 nuclear transport factor 2 family protein [Catalinimonas niigatensis]